MEKLEKIALKAACVQAAATLMAALATPAAAGQTGEPAADTGSCARYALDLFGKLTNEPWENEQDGPVATQGADEGKDRHPP